MRVLLVKLSSFGDVIHTFPAITDLQAARPDVEIDWAVEEAFASIAALHPGVSNVHRVAFRRLRASPLRWPALAASYLDLRRAFRARRYDLVLDAQALMKSAVVARLAGAPIAGHDSASAREPAASRAYATRIAVRKDLHAVERTRRLFGAALGYEPMGEGAYGIGTPEPSSRVASLQKPVLLLPMASWPSKLWPEEGWHSLTRAITQNGAGVILAWGNAAEKARAERIAHGVDGAIVLQAVLSGVELASVVAGAQLAIGLDSGLMHFAAALGVPGVWLYGPTDPGLTGPYGPGQEVIASTHPAAPCRTRDCAHSPPGEGCMAAIPADRVIEAATRRLAALNAWVP